MQLEDLLQREGSPDARVKKVVYCPKQGKIRLLLLCAQPWDEPQEQIVRTQLEALFGVSVELHLHRDHEKNPLSEEEKEALLPKEVPFTLSAPISALSKPAVKPQPPEEGFRMGRWGKKDLENVCPLQEVNVESGLCTTRGEIIDCQQILTKNGYLLLTFDLGDEAGGALRAKAFFKKNEHEAAKASLRNGTYVYAKGRLQYDEYARDYLFMANAFAAAAPLPSVDPATEKRIEWTVHTQMSNMEGLIAPKALAKRLKDWGHQAVGITDAGSVQAYPLIYDALRGTGIRPLFGYHAKMLWDEHKILTNRYHKDLSAYEGAYTVFDIETTGFSRFTDRIIEIGAVRYENGVRVATFDEFVSPGRALPEKIISLTGITDAMLAGADSIDQVLPRFLDFAKGSILVAHNADFDVGFLVENAHRLHLSFEPVFLDTLGLARCLHPEYNNHKLDTLTKRLNVTLVHHHRASDDALATGEVFLKLMAEWAEKGQPLSEINRTPSDFPVARHTSYEAMIYCQKQEGLKNLYALVSEGNMEYFFKTPGIPQSRWDAQREGLVIATGFVGSELFEAVSRREPQDHLLAIASKYDAIFVQPIAYWQKALHHELVEDRDHYAGLVETILHLGEMLDLPVLAVGTPYYLDAKEKMARNVLVNYQRKVELEEEERYRLLSTNEMLAGFPQLPPHRAEELVIHAPARWAQTFEDVRPIPEGTFTPKLAGAEETLRNLTTERAKALYGDPLPELVEKRLQRELDSIISNGYASLYVIAQKLVAKSNEDGYLVGSRGSVGSSFAATMAGITEVNPLVPHYVCPKCKHSEFFEKGEVGSGFDLPKKDCPHCHTPMHRDGQDIPFEVFLGFHGDKEPDIDLNFAGEYMATIHKYTEALFGEGKVFRAGTISGIQERTAYGLIRKYLEQPYIPSEDRNISEARIRALQHMLLGTKRTTGQHAGGLMIVPHDMSILDFCPIQYPADDANSGVVTTHFSYKNLSGRMLKLDELGHTSPTIIRQLEEMTGIDPLGISFDDPETMSIFSSASSLRPKAPYSNEADGSLGIPEFGTGFVRGMLKDTSPSTFSELVRISGLSHGTDVWSNNAQELVRSGTTDLAHAICTRDDIMIYLISKGVEKLTSFKTMESVRKGKKIPEGVEEILREHGVPEWYITSCNKIQYMFPKAHAAAYVMMSYRIAWFKVHRPAAFYATYYTQRLADFSTTFLFSNLQSVQNYMKAHHPEQAPEQALDNNKWTLLEVVEEMYARGYRFGKVDLYRSEATTFTLLDDQTVLPPLASLDDVSEAMARSLVQARQNGEFLSREDLREQAPGLTKRAIQSMTDYGLLDTLPETNQISFFPGF